MIKFDFLISVLLILFSIQFSSCQKVEIKENERGVIFKRFENGVDTSRVFLPGNHKVANYDRLIIYNINSKTDQEEVTVLAKDKVPMVVNIIYSFKLIPDKVALLHYYVGNNFHESIVKPRITSSIQNLFNSYLESEVNLADKESLENKIFTNAKVQIRKQYIELESLKIVNITKG